MLNLNIEPRGLASLDQLIDGLSSMEARMGDWRPVWPSVAAVFYARMAQTFASSGGGRWPGLSARYAHWKSSRFGSQPLLVRSGVLQASLMGPDAPGAILRATKTRMDIGTSVKYAKPVAKRRSFGIPVGSMSRVGVQTFLLVTWANRRSELPGLAAV